ncbi:unnamed protein product [Didymodactylos carnosus]|uniref:Uncharacterized protein n=1 Tax=Didymodactylos carnosus TaxID=1234261 RepID=A0A8S2GJC9_9BILA|nr:unnamed protein product [Didymodactylos carnosus]CAF3516385.1 unnamed protein product [Didymodactylos carnosus]
MQLIETTSSSSSNSSSKSVFERQRRHHGKKITQQRFCVSQEDLNQALLRMHTRKKHHSKDIYQTPSASVEITKASSQEENSLPVSTLIKEFEQLGGNINSKKTTRIRTTFVSALDLVRRDSSDIPYTSADQTRSSSFSHETDLSMSSKQEPKQMDKPSAEEENRNFDDVEQISRQMLSIDTSLAEILNSVNQLNEISRNFEILAADNCSQTVEKYVPLEIHRQIFDNDNNTNNNVWSKINVCNNNYKHMSDVQEVIAVKDKSIIESSMSKTITTSSVCSTISSHSILLQPQLETVTLSSSSPSLVALTNNNNNKNITTTTTTLVPSNSVIEKIENDEEQLDRNNNNDKSIDKKRSAFSSTSSSTSNNKQQLLNDKINFDSDNDILTMLTTRSTDIDQVIAAQSKIRLTHHQNVNNNDQTILLKELLLKEKNLNYALSDLVAITGTKNDDNHSTIDLNKFRDNDIIRRSKSFDNQRIQTTIPKKKIQAIYDADVSSSNCSTSSLSIAIDRNNTNLSQTSSNDLSTSIAILNHLLDDLNIKPSDIGSETLSRKCSNQQRTNLFKCDVKPINMFW